MEGDKVGADEGAYPVNKNVERKSVRRLVRRSNDAEVGRSCQGLPSALFVENFFSLGKMQF